MAPFDLGSDLGADYHLLKNGAVLLYSKRNVLDEDAGMLTGLGYDLHRFTASAWQDMAGFAADVKQGLGFPDHFGGNLDAFNDCLRDVATYEYGASADKTGTVLVFTGYDAFAAREPRAAQVILDVIADNVRFAMLFGHRMACLVQVDDPATRFEPVGAVAVAWRPGAR